MEIVIKGDKLAEWKARTVKSYRWRMSVNPPGDKREKSWKKLKKDMDRYFISLMLKIKNGI